MNPHGFVHRTEISIRPCFFGFLGSTIMNPYYLQMEFQLSIIYDSSDGHLEPHLVCCIHLVWTCQTANFGCVSPPMLVGFKHHLGSKLRFWLIPTPLECSATPKPSKRVELGSTTQVLRDHGERLCQGHCRGGSRSMAFGHGEGRKPGKTGGQPVQEE